MANQNILSRFGNFLARQSGNLTIGIIIILVWGWAYLRTGDIFPVNTGAWRFYIQTWIIFFGFTITISGVLARKYVGDLFKFPFLKDFLKFPIFAIIFGLIFYILIYFVKGAVAPTFIIPIGIIFLYCFFNSYPEEIVFRGLIPNALKGLGWNKFAISTFSTMAFAFFHYALGKNILTLIIYIPLGYLFFFIKERYSPVTNFANAGVHFAWNIILFMFGI